MSCFSKILAYSDYFILWKVWTATNVYTVFSLAGNLLSLSTQNSWIVLLGSASPLVSTRMKSSW